MITKIFSLRQTLKDAKDFRKNPEEFSANFTSSTIFGYIFAYLLIILLATIVSFILGYIAPKWLFFKITFWLILPILLFISFTTYFVTQKIKRLTKRFVKKSKSYVENKYKHVTDVKEE